MNYFQKNILSIFIGSMPLFLSAQDDGMQRMMDSIANLEKGKKEFVIATFKTTRLINLQTTETAGRHSLDYRIQHRFGDFNTGANNAWGADGPANLYMSLEYSYDGRLMFSIGRSSMDKLAEAFLKFRLLRQATNGMPLSVTLYSSINYTATIDPNKAVNGYDKYAHVSDRLSYAHMILIGRKFSKRLSLEVAPTLIHYNLVENARDQNDMFAIGFGGRYKITSRMAISAEYVARVSKYSDNFSKYYDSAGVGLDIETGGHVFQIIFTNSFGINEVQYIPYTQTSWSNMGIRLGFNMSRVFAVGGHE